MALCSRFLQWMKPLWGRVRGVNRRVYGEEQQGPIGPPEVLQGPAGYTIPDLLRPYPLFKR